MENWKLFGYGELPEWNTIVEIMEKYKTETIQKVFYGSEDHLNPDKTIPNIVKSGKIGKKLLWKKI
jgi:hypothetical protein